MWNLTVSSGALAKKEKNNNCLTRNVRGAMTFILGSSDHIVFSN